MFHREPAWRKTSIGPIAVDENIWSSSKIVISVMQTPCSRCHRLALLPTYNGVSAILLQALFLPILGPPRHPVSEKNRFKKGIPNAHCRKVSNSHQRRRGGPDVLHHRRRQSYTVHCQI